MTPRNTNYIYKRMINNNHIVSYHVFPIYHNQQYQHNFLLQCKYLHIFYLSLSNHILLNHFQYNFYYSLQQTNSFSIYSVFVGPPLSQTPFKLSHKYSYYNPSILSQNKIIYNFLFSISFLFISNIIT